MLISLFTDASHNDKFNRAGWGAWARSERGRVYNGGAVLGVEVPDSQVAELHGAVEGLKMTIRSGIALNGDRVMIQCDNLGVVEIINLRRTPRPSEKALAKELHKIKHEHRLNVWAKHIKAHTNKNGKGYKSRNFVNDLCDRLAKKGRKRADAHSAMIQSDDPNARCNKVRTLEYLQDRIEMSKHLADDVKSAEREGRLPPNPTRQEPDKFTVDFS